MFGWKHWWHLSLAIIGFRFCGLFTSSLWYQKLMVLPIVGVFCNQWLAHGKAGIFFYQKKKKAEKISKLAQELNCPEIPLHIFFKVTNNFCFGLFHLDGNHVLLNYFSMSHLLTSEYILNLFLRWNCGRFSRRTNLIISQMNDWKTYSPTVLNTISSIPVVGAREL